MFKHVFYTHFADGQKLATRYNKQISKSASVLQKSLQQYNNEEFVCSGLIPDRLDYSKDMIADPDAAIYSHLINENQVI